ncbi:MAG TPA: hypothetical protein VF331_00890 [Polyangiales bacterium]
MKTARSGLLLWVCGSLLLHSLGYLTMRWAGALPDVGFQFELPTQVEFGLADATPLPPAGLPLSAAPPAAASADAQNIDVALPEAPAAPKPKKKKRPAATTPDAGAPSEASADAGPDAHVPQPADAAVPATVVATNTAADGGAGTAQAAQDAGTPALTAYAPAGAQLALRIDMERVRASELAPDVRDMLDAIPDFDAILGGSGVQPVDDLVRLFVASPNLERSSLVMAGSYRGGESVARRAVATLARAHDKPARWRKLHGIAVAPWQNADPTERVLALIGPSLFAITRPDDLPRIIAVAHALAVRDRKKHEPADANAAAEALLAMDDNEAVAFSVENAKSFVRGQVDQVPERVRISIRFQTDGSIEVASSGAYESQPLAENARVFWQDVRDRFARHPLVALIGMSGALHDTTIQARDAELHARTSLSVDQVRTLLGFLRGALAPAHGRGPTLPGAPRNAPPGAAASP